MVTTKSSSETLIPNYDVSWSPIFTRFWKSEILDLLKIDISLLELAQSIDENICEVQDVDDVSPRGRYFNFWSVFRLIVFKTFGEKTYTEICGIGALDEFEDLLTESGEGRHFVNMNVASMLLFSCGETATSQDTPFFNFNVMKPTFVDYRDIALDTAVWASNILARSEPSPNVAKPGGGVPVLLHDVARVEIVPDERRGIA